MANIPPTKYTIPGGSSVNFGKIIDLGAVQVTNGICRREYIMLYENNTQGHFIGTKLQGERSMIIEIASGSSAGWYVHGRRYDSKEECERFLDLKMFW